MIFLIWSSNNLTRLSRLIHSFGSNVMTQYMWDLKKIIRCIFWYITKVFHMEVHPFVRVNLLICWLEAWLVWDRRRNLTFPRKGCFGLLTRASRLNNPQCTARSSAKSMINFFTEPKIKNKCEIEKNNFEFWF